MARDSSLGSKFYVEQDMTGAEMVDVAEGHAAIFSTRCPEKLTPNEDCAAVIPYDADSGILVVADGMGGQPAGAQASRLAIGALKASLAEGANIDLPLRAAILNGFEEANQAVRELAIGAATTLAVVEIHSGTVRPYHVGDSMILTVGLRGKVKLRTVSHSPVGYAVEAGFLDQEEAMHHDERHLISNIIGSSDMHITIGSAVELAHHDTVLVASDGLWDNLHFDQLVERVRKGPLHQAAKRLVHDSLDRMAKPVEGHPSKPDDMTFILYRWKKNTASS